MAYCLGSLSYGLVCFLTVNLYLIGCTFLVELYRDFCKKTHQFWFLLVASQIFNLHISSSSNLFCVGIQLVLLFGCDLDILFAPCLVEMLWLVLTLWYGVQLRSLMCWDSTVGSLVKMDSLELTMNLAKIGLIQSVSLWINSIEVVGFFVCVCGGGNRQPWFRFSYKPLLVFWSWM